MEPAQYHNVNTNTSSNVDLYKLNVKVEAGGKMVQTNKIQKQQKMEINNLQRIPIYILVLSHSSYLLVQN